MCRFKSKTDLWLTLVIYTSATLCLVTSVYVIYVEPKITTYIIATFIFSIGFIFPIWLVHSTEYVVDESKLNVSCGPFKWVINLSDITKVVESNDPISSPALSLDRLEVSYGKGNKILISPKDKKGFIKALKLKKHN